MPTPTTSCLLARFTQTAAALAALATLAACVGEISTGNGEGSGSGSGSGSGDTIAFDEYLAARFDAECVSATACDFFPDLETCKLARFRDPGREQTIVHAVDAGTLVYDPAAAARCIAETRVMSCAFSGFHATAAELACADVLTGTLALGDTCSIDDECADDGVCQPLDSQCYPFDTCCIGRCVRPERMPVALGASCANNEYCQDSYCEPETLRCTPLITTPGAPCTTGDACANPMVCDVTPDLPTSTCRMPSARGEPCDPAVFVPCADVRDYCNETTLVCTRMATLGDSCATDPCVWDTSCVAGECVPRLLPGQACGDTTASCLGEAGCFDNGRCEFPAPTVACP
ncbi:MAG TPA: hypothetical protein VFQ53_07035 [Kofleriaceae bacterium]|nr:hypothetical protein [Kofleriaceae bacterium]